MQRRKQLRKQFFGKSKVAQCAACNAVGPLLFFDVDHKVALRFGGPDLPWNLWSLCLNHHRLKSAREAQLAKQLGDEQLCFACFKVSSHHFAQTVPYLCNDCALNNERFKLIEETVKHILLQTK